MIRTDQESPQGSTGLQGDLVWIDSSPLVIGAAEAGMPRRWLGEAKTEPDGIPAEARPMPQRDQGPD